LSKSRRPPAPTEEEKSHRRKGVSTSTEKRNARSSASKARRKTTAKPTGSGAIGRQKLRHDLEVHQSELEIQNEELRLARTQVEAALERYTQLFDFAPIGYACLTAEGAILELNHFGAGLLGQPRFALVGRAFHSNVVTDDRSRFQATMKDVIEQEGSKACEVRLRRWEAGQHFPARITMTALKGSEVSVLIAFEDVSAQKRAEWTLREMDRRKDEFLALVSHELRTPLSILLLHSRLLQRDGMDPKTQRSAQAMERAARAQARLIDDLLDVSRVVAGKFTMQVGSVDLASILRAVVDALAHEAQRKQIYMSTQFEGDIPPTSGDASRLQQALTNVVENALKFTPQGGRVSVRLSRVDEQARIEVRDTGVGIDREFLPHVFERFSQADSSSTRSTSGLGLGLAIVRSIVLAHGGTAQAKSGGRGKGATITLSLPLTAPSEQSTSPAAFTSPDVRLKGAKLLVVEDDPGTRSTLTEVLSHEGAEVREAESSRAAMRVLDEFEPDVLVCDIAMPEEDGYTLLRRIRARGPERIRSLALTAYASDEERARTRAAGFEKHLVKPVDVEQLLTAISSLLSKAGATSLTV
jgi:PAS domain S-box-containing protein